MPATVDGETLEITLFGENSLGCKDSLDVVIFIEDTDEISVSKIITPNGDRINDILEIVNIEDFPENEVVVYDRRGRVIFSIKDFENNSSESEEMSDNLLDGIYFYKIDLGENEIVDGSFLVIR